MSPGSREGFQKNHHLSPSPCRHPNPKRYGCECGRSSGYSFLHHPCGGIGPIGYTTLAYYVRDTHYRGTLPNRPPWRVTTLIIVVVEQRELHAMRICLGVFSM